MSSPGSIQETGIPLGVAGQPLQIAIVPAKRNSKRCSEKNWKDFTRDRQSLAEIAVDKAVGSGFFNKTVLSIDFPKKDVTFLNLQTRYPPMRIGLVVKRRSIWLADDSVAVALDALDYVKATDDDIYCLLQPTSPFVGKESIWNALQSVMANRQPVVSVNPMFKPSGGIYAGLVGNLRKYWNFFEPLVMPLKLDWRESIDIDYPYDFEIARGLYE